MTENINNVLITSITPYFLEKEASFFTENLEKILQSAKTQSFFQDNILYLQKDKEYKLYDILRKLDEMGYEKVFKVAEMGEFSQIGGVIDVFPVNESNAFRLDFLGNKLEVIKSLDVAVKDHAKAKEVLQKHLKSQKLFSDLKSIKPGDYLVHLDHGVGRFVGFEEMSHKEDFRVIPRKIPRSSAMQYYVLEYAQSDKLFVPLGLERKLSRYVGFSDPIISRLGSSIWQKTKRKIKEDVQILAKLLLELYAKKETTQRKPYIIDKELEKQFEESFLYEETPDQLQAIEDIKNDLLQEKPMDRIVAGDVGFGKTEVAMRAALLAVSNSRQTALICPTTILAKQHFDNFKERFGKLPVKVALLSRLQTKKEQQKIIEEIKSGKADIIIGTHRLLSKDVQFSNLQLLIIDDEQRFGVKQKEKLRQSHPALDILSLSATPIPRTLYLALASFKNVSLVQTPPIGRMAIETKVMLYSLPKVKEAIEFELARGGQVYYLHNRVESLQKVIKRLEKHLYSTFRTFEKLSIKPKISFIHGKMPEKEIIKVMDEFSQGKADVLVATTIIENGIDLPNVNTIIVEDASRLGLAQAYQIRGRVGRSHIKSYAYLFFPKRLNDLAKKRLKVLSQAKELGAGYQIAMKDLELRGAGNILGREQSGSINKIGLNLYCQMLSDAVEKLRQ